MCERKDVYGLLIGAVLLLSSCRMQDTVLAYYPTDIAYDLVKETNIRSWKLLPKKEAEPILSKMRKIHMGHETWPEEVTIAENRNLVHPIVFEAGASDATYWLVHEGRDGKKLES
jgi:hypothetical protein